jgi:hypothetical protein
VEALSQLPFTTQPFEEKSEENCTVYSDSKFFFKTFKKKKKYIYI